MNAFWAFKTSVFMKGVSLKDNLFCRNLGNGVYRVVGESSNMTSREGD
jgi:hypothetical protein